MFGAILNRMMQKCYIFLISVDRYLQPIYMMDFAASNNIIVDTIGPEEAI